MDERVRCKFVCTEMTKRLGWGDKAQWDYKFNAVTSSSEENKLFWEATPSGSLVISTINQDLFEPGKEYYLDLIPA